MLCIRFFKRNQIHWLLNRLPAGEAFAPRGKPGAKVLTLWSEPVQVFFRDKALQFWVNAILLPGSFSSGLFPYRIIKFPNKRIKGHAIELSLTIENKHVIRTCRMSFPLYINPQNTPNIWPENPGQKVLPGANVQHDNKGKMVSSYSCTGA